MEKIRKVRIKDNRVRWVKEVEEEEGDPSEQEGWERQDGKKPTELKHKTKGREGMSTDVQGDRWTDWVKGNQGKEE